MTNAGSPEAPAPMSAIVPAFLGVNHLVARYGNADFMATMAEEHRITMAGRIAWFLRDPEAHLALARQNGNIDEADDFAAHRTEYEAAGDYWLKLSLSAEHVDRQFFVEENARTLELAGLPAGIVAVRLYTSIGQVYMQQPGGSNGLVPESSASVYFIHADKSDATASSRTLHQIGMINLGGNPIFYRKYEDSGLDDTDVSVEQFLVPRQMTAEAAQVQTESPESRIQNREVRWLDDLVNLKMSS